jgi:cell division protein FtsB
MDKKARFMEAVAQKVGKRTPMMKRKGGPSVLIAIGAPKPGPMMEGKMGKDKAEEMDGEEKMSKADKIAALQEKIASLKAELALLEDEDEEMDDEMEMEKDEQEYEDEDED